MNGAYPLWEADRERTVVAGLPRGVRAVLIMGLHTLHLLTDAGESAVLLALLSREPLKRKNFSDVNDGCVYWYFVVLAWLPLYSLIYLAPRLQ